MPALQLRMLPQEFHQLPRHPAYRYEYHAGSAWLNPRPRYYHARLDLPAGPTEGAANVRLRPLLDEHWEALVDLFAEAFAGHQPFAGLAEPLRPIAARQCLEQTRDGGDGPWIRPASYVALSADGALLGGVLITLLPPGDPCDWNTYTWDSPPPADCIERCAGQPHLTWIFTHPESKGCGIGSALLQAAAGRLSRLGFDRLLSTFLLGNESSMLWHWRCGFRLLSYPGSRRRDLSEG